MIVMIGESGSGKSAIEDVLVNKYGYERTVSYTTRQITENEIDGIDYNFISFDEYVKKFNSGFFVETGNDNGYFYGTTYDQYNKNTVCIVTPNGLRELKKNINKDKLDVHYCYIKVPRRDRLIKMLQRGDNIDKLLEKDKKDKIQYEDIEKEVDYVIENINWFSDPENMTEKLLDQIKKNKKIE